MHEYFCRSTETGSFESFAVVSQGGIGKSQIVNQCVHTHKQEFPVILWIAADSREKIEQAYSAIAIKLGLMEEGSAQARQTMHATQLVLSWLRKPCERRDSEEPAHVNWLVVFDGVEDPDELKDFWPHFDFGAVLVTSRNDTVNSPFHDIQSGLSLEPFSTDESIKLFTKYTGRSGSEEDREQFEVVASIVDGLPLAIFQTAGVILKGHMSFGECVELYQNEGTRARMMDAPQIGLRAHDRAHEYKDTLASGWRFDKLKESTHLMDVLAFLDPDGIPEFIFHDLGKVETDVEILPSGHEYTQARSQLLDMSLITRDMGQRKLLIHRLVQEAARAKMSGEQYSKVLISQNNLRPEYENVQSLYPCPSHGPLHFPDTSCLSHW